MLDQITDAKLDSLAIIDMHPNVVTDCWFTSKTDSPSFAIVERKYWQIL